MVIKCIYQLATTQTSKNKTLLKKENKTTISIFSSTLIVSAEQAAVLNKKKVWKQMADKVGDLLAEHAAVENLAYVCCSVY